jgi:hypothetical protein
MKASNPRRAARVVNSGQAERVDLYRFDRSGNEVPRHPKVLADLLQVSERYLALIGKKARILSKKAASFTVDFPLGSGDVWSSHAHRPKEGMMHAEFLRLETPASQAFYAYEYSGDKENYFAFIRDFGATENRAVGRILNFDTFVQEDGRKFPPSACKCMKVNE